MLTQPSLEKACWTERCSYLTPWCVECIRYLTRDSHHKPDSTVYVTTLDNIVDALKNRCGTVFDKAYGTPVGMVFITPESACSA